MERPCTNYFFERKSAARNAKSKTAATCIVDYKWNSYDRTNKKAMTKYWQKEISEGKPMQQMQHMETVFEAIKECQCARLGHFISIHWKMVYKELHLITFLIRLSGTVSSGDSVVYCALENYLLQEYANYNISWYNCTVHDKINDDE